MSSDTGASLFDSGYRKQIEQSVKNTEHLIRIVFKMEKHLSKNKVMLENLSSRVKKLEQKAKQPVNLKTIEKEARKRADERRKIREKELAKNRRKEAEKAAERKKQIQVLKNQNEFLEAMTDPDWEETQPHVYDEKTGKLRMADHDDEFDNMEEELRKLGIE